MKIGEFVRIRINKNILEKLVQYAMKNVNILESEAEFKEGKDDEIIKIELDTAKIILLKLSLHSLQIEKEIIIMELDYEELRVFRNMVYLNNQVCLKNERTNRRNMENLMGFEERLEKIWSGELM